MIRLSDAMLLAYTKLRARKTRLIVTVVISSLLFGVLAVSSFVVRGIVKSTGSFAEEGFGKRYLLSADPNLSNQNVFENKDVLDRATALQKDQIARKKVEAKRLGIDYNPATERLVSQEGGGPNGKERFLDSSHPLAIQAIKEYLAAHPSAGLPELKKLSEPYKAIRFYESRYLAFDNPQSGELKVLKDGKESFEDKNQGGNPFGQGLDSFTSSWSLMSSELLKTFTLDGTDGASVSKDGVLPIVAPYTAVEQLLKLKPLPPSASAANRLERLKEVRAKADSVEFGVCYRNSSSSELISQAQSTIREIEQNKNNKDFEKPRLIYSLPTEPCGAARVSRDVRTAEEKVQDSKQLTFRQMFGEQVPEQAILRFRVIGVSPDPPGFNAAFLDGLISSILTSNIGVNWFTPLELGSTNPILAKFFPDTQLMGRPNSYYVELSTAELAKQMLDKANCNIDIFGEDTGMVDGPGGPGINVSGPVDACAKAGKVFFLSPYGSSSLALNEFQNRFAKVFRVVATVIAIIAAIIMMGTLGRVIADARRETAVFRAIGAKRIDIAQVYVTYALVVSVMIAMCAILMGFILAQWAQSSWGSQFTVKALVAYNARDLTREFQLFAWSSDDILYIVLAALSAGLISTILPLIRNLRRNPIRDMRDEN